MIREFNGRRPNIAPSAFVSEAAYVIGDVLIGNNSSIWPGAVIMGWILFDLLGEIAYTPVNKKALLITITYHQIKRFLNDDTFSFVGMT